MVHGDQIQLINLSRFAYAKCLCSSDADCLIYVSGFAISMLIRHLPLTLCGKEEVDQDKSKTIESELILVQKSASLA